MRKLVFCFMLAFTLTAPSLAATYNVNNSMSAPAISSTAATAAGGTGNTVQFAAGTYNLSGSLNLPCTNGVIYQGIAITEPNISNVPAVVLTGPNASSYSINVPSNGTGNTSYTAGCQFKYLGFSGQHGGIYVNYPASGMNIQYNYFTLNDGKYAGGSGTTANQNIHLAGNCPSSGSGNLCGASLGVSWIQIDANVFYNQCATIRAQGAIDSQAFCSAVFAFGYNNQLKLTNNIVNLIEEGFKWQEVYYKITNVSNNLDVENNNMSGNSRILIENQQNSNGNAVFSHNAHYQPYNPGFNTFEDSIPMNQASPAAGLNDNVYIGNVPITFGGSGAHYGYGQEVWGAGMNGQWNVSQGGNSTGSGVCAGYTRGGFFCSGWATIMGGNNAGQSWINNYYSGADVWTGTANNGGYAFQVEDGASLGNATLNPNTVVQTSTTLATANPVISPNGGSFSGPVTVTLSDPDSVHRNVSIFYTTDGSTPAPFVIGGSAGTSQVYAAPFVVPLGTTVKAIAQWGQGANQGISFPSFGWVPSSVTSQTYSSGGTITLQSVTVAGVGGATVQVGATLQLAATCHYSDGSTTPCNTLDTHGNVVTAWNASNGNLTVNSSGLATGVSIGTTNVTVTVTGGLVSTPALAVTVSASPLTLGSVSLATTGGVSSLATMQTNQLIATCHYNDGSSTACNTVDSHGNGVSTFSSSVPASAAVNTSGLVSGVAAGSTNLTASVIPAPAMLGSNVFTTTGSTSAGYINYNYGVTGTAPGTYTPGACQIYVPAMSWTAGQFIDCILTLATSPTTQASSAFCSNRFTTTGSSWPGGFISISMASCPGLPKDTAFWLGNQTNIPGTPGQGFNNCGGGCNGVVPTQGSGTYGYWYVPNPTIGNYTGMTTALLAGGALQVSEYLTLTTNSITSANLPLTIVASPPTLLSAYLTAGGSSLVVPNTLQMAAKCHYSSGADQDCTVADIYGDAVTQWNTSDATKATIGAVGSANPGLVTAVAAGTPSITARIAGTGPTSAAYPITITNAPVTLTGISLATTGGVTGLFVGFTNQLKATCTYSDGSSDDCTTTDAHGTLAHSYTSTTPAHATVNATSGLVTGVASGSTTFTAVAGSFTSSAVPLAVFPVLSGIYTITISGPVKFSGTVRF
jgi:Chitobiase/beta-hexosaminidase C-terminal domain